MKKVARGEWADHTSVRGYAKKRATVYLTEDGGDPEKGTPIGYIKTEPVLTHGGEASGEVVYYRGKYAPGERGGHIGIHGSRGGTAEAPMPTGFYFDSVRALLAAVQKRYDFEFQASRKTQSALN